MDREYTLEYGLGKQDGVARPFLKGRMNTNIKYNITSKMWEMRHLHSPNYALLTDPRAKGGSVYPIGRFPFDFFILYKFYVKVLHFLFSVNKFVI